MARLHWHRIIITLALAAAAVVALSMGGIPSAGPGPAEGAFPGTNGKIAFTSFRDGSCCFSDLEIYAMNADGSGATRLTNNAAWDDGPAWSPDGSKIAFETKRDGNSQIYAMNADGSGPTRLTNNPTTH